MGRVFIQYLHGRLYSCKCCGCHLASCEDLLSKNFHSRNGTAYLFDSAINVMLGPPEERDMTTGKHEVRDLYCVNCNLLLGWRYEYAQERREKYKEGKIILEKCKIVGMEEGGGSPLASSLGSAFDTMSLLSDVDDCTYLASDPAGR